MNQHLDSPTLDAYAEGALRWAVRQEVEDHLRGCDQCRKKLAYHRQLAALAARLPFEPAPPLFRLRIKNAVLLTIARREHFRTQMRRAGYFVLACTLVGATLIASAWTQLVALVNALADVPPSLTAEALLTWMTTGSMDSSAGLVNSGLNWQSSLEQGIDIALLLGLVLLCLAAVGELARILARVDLAVEWFYPPEGESE